MASGEEILKALKKGLPSKVVPSLACSNTANGQLSKGCAFHVSGTVREIIERYIVY
jgi:hypothetical protein